VARQVAGERRPVVGGHDRGEFVRDRRRVGRRGPPGEVVQLRCEAPFQARAQAQQVQVPFPGVVDAVPAAVSELVADEERQLEVLVVLRRGAGRQFRSVAGEDVDQRTGQGAAWRGKFHGVPASRQNPR
jgi:hypothetical protein